MKSALVRAGMKAEYPETSDDNPKKGNSRWFTYQIIQTARVLDYYANVYQPRYWSRIAIKKPTPVDRVVSLHFAGDFRRKLLMAATVFLSRRLAAEGKEREFIVESACLEPFFFTESEPQDTALDAGFDRWLGESLALAMEKWRRSL